MSDGRHNGPGRPDPLDALAGHDGPVTPRAAFADRLRRRLLTEVEDLMPTDPDPSTPTTQTPAVVAPGEVPDELLNPGSLFYFTLPGPDVERSARFYRELFGWELHRGDAGYHVANVYPPMGLASNDSTDPEVWIEVTDIDASVAAVRRLGGQADQPVHYDSGWSATCRAPGGARFHLSVPRADYRQPARSSTEPGELFYWTLPAPDADVSRAFYHELFDWEYTDPAERGGIHIANRQPDGGLGAGREGTAPELYFRVADLDRAIDRVRDLGGTAEAVGGGPEGRHALCVDDQGVPFGISQPSPGY